MPEACYDVDAMILHVWASTDAAGYAILDPAAVPATTGKLVEEAFETILTQNALGNLILYSDSFFGAVGLRIYVNEEPGDELRLRAANAARDGVCRFPSGRIVLTGVESIERAREEPEATSGAELPPGTYAAEGFDVEWEPRQVRRALRERVGGLAYTMRGLLHVTTGGGCMGLTIALMILAAGAAIGWTIGLIVAGIFSALIAGSTLLRRLPAMKRVDEAERELEMQFPPVVLVLRKLPEDADLSQLQGLAFGRGHIQRQRTRGFEVVFPTEKA